MAVSKAAPEGLLRVCSALLALALLASWAGGQPPAADLVVSGGIVVTMDASRRVLEPGAVAIRGTDIVAVGEVADVRSRFPDARTIDARRTIVLPGLINTHTHAPMVLYRGLADDLPLMEWLQQYIFPAEARTVSPSFVRAGTRLAVLEMIRSGTTTFTDMYYFEEEIAAAAREAGLRAVLGQTIIGVPAPDARTPRQALDRAEAFIQAFKDDPLIVPAVAPHSIYLLEREDLLASRELAAKYGVPLLIHLAETEAEIETVRKRHGTTPVAYLDGMGFWSRPTLAAHGIWMTEADVSTLATHHVGVSHNPESNMKLASGVAPVPDYLAAGVPLGLGTDGAASNNDLDMFDAMRQTALLHKLTSGDPGAVPARVVLEMATIGGARALGLDRLVGTLEPGKRADLIIVDAGHPRLTPMYNAVSHLVYAARGDDVVTMIVNGRVLMEGRRVQSIDEAQVLAEAVTIAESVRRAVRTRAARAF